MTHRSSLKAKAATTAAFAAIIITGLAISSPGRAASDQSSSDENSRIQIGFSVAPVPLNLVGKNRSLVGLGSYIVNVQAECNGCHSAGPATEYLGNPYLFAPPSTTVHQTKKVSPATYLGGGRDFGAFPAPNSPLHIYSRNLTPDDSGKPEGGHTLAEFKVIFRTGRDYDLVHPTCPPNTPQTSSCVPYPFDGNLLEVMPWPAYQDYTDHDIEAIYEYLSAIPCVDTIVAGQPQLRNTCPVH